MSWVFNGALISLCTVAVSQHMKILSVQKPWAPFCCLSYCHWTCDVGNGNSFYFSSSLICFLKWEDSSQEEFLTKNELWILLTYDDAKVGIVIIFSCISSSGSLALKLRILVSVCVCVRVRARALSCALFVTPQTVCGQAPLSMGFPRQEYWSGFPFPSPGDLPNPRTEPTSSVLAGGFFTTSTSWEAQ